MSPINSEREEHRVRLRAVEPEDALVMYEVENDVEEWFYSERIAPLSMYALKKYAEETLFDPFTEKQLRLMAVNDDGEVCGIVDLYDINPMDRTSFVGIIILKKFRCQGYGQAALRELEKYSRNMRLRILGAKIASVNVASLKLFKKCNFFEAGVLRHWIDTPEGGVDMMIMQRDL